MYYRGASAAILVFDISKRDSFAVMKVPRPLPAMEGGPFPLLPFPHALSDLHVRRFREGAILFAAMKRPPSCTVQPATDDGQHAGHRVARCSAHRDKRSFVCLFAAAYRSGLGARAAEQPQLRPRYVLAV